MRSLRSRLRAAVRPLLAAAGILGFGVALSCDSAREDAANISINKLDSIDFAAPPVKAPESKASAPPASPIELRYLDWVVSHCHVDELMPSAYTHAWHRYPRPADLLGPDDPVPLRVGRILPPEGSAAAKEQAAALKTAWLKSPRSHVIDCSLPIRTRRCPSCAVETVAHAHYVAYLPRALFVAPKTVRSVLLLVPGGNGGRSRPFMRPIPGRSVYDKGSGGLDTKRLADAFYSANQGASQAIVIALETSGLEVPSGSVEHLSHTMPGHIAETFLPHLSERDLVVGAEGVSSGAREIFRAAFHAPARFHTIGLSCMACGGIHPKTSRLAAPSEIRAFADVLADRRRKGSFDIRFAIGSRDGQLDCNKTFYDLFVEKGVFANTDKDSFLIYDGEKHDFNFLRKSYAAQLEWHLAALHRIARRAKQ